METITPTCVLFERLSRQPDFPSLPSLMPEVRHLSRSDTARVQSLSAALLKDIGLSQRLLRLVNAAYYRSAGAGQIVTVTRGIAVLGFEAVGRLAVGARLIDSAMRGGGSAPLRVECLRSMLAALLADHLSEGRPDWEDAYLAAMLRNLGRLLLALHQPAEAQAVRSALPQPCWPRGGEEDRIARRHLGLGTSEIGRQLASQWGWPEVLGRAMLRDAFDDAPLRSGTFGVVQLAALADELADLMLYVEASGWDAACARLAVHPQGPDARRLAAVLGRARLRLADLAAALDLPLSHFPAWGGRPDTARHEETAPLPAPLSMTEPASAAGAEPPRGSELLSIAIQDLSAALVGGGDALDSVPTLALESLWRGLDARAALLCLRQGGRGSLQGVMSFSRDGPQRWHEPCRIDLDMPQDLFAMLCRRGADTVIDDATEPRIAQRLPAWFKHGPAASRFMVLPLLSRGTPVGMVYLDAGGQADLRPDEHTVRLARSLRNQLVLALPVP